MVKKKTHRVFLHYDYYDTVDVSEFLDTFMQGIKDTPPESLSNTLFTTMFNRYQLDTDPLNCSPFFS